MKKTIMTMVMALMAVASNAQTWEKSIEPGDELKGTIDKVKYRMADSVAMQVMVFYQPGDFWKVGIARNAFQQDKRGLVHKKSLNFLTYATIGFYDEQNRLVKKWENCMVELTNGMQVAETSENIWGKTSKGCRDVVPYLMSERGYVRIIIPTVIGKEFDMKVPCIHNDEE